MESYIGLIKLFAGNYAPRNWAFCDGRLLSIQENQALFSIIGTTYGGDGSTTFALPDLRGRVPMGAGAAPGLTPRALGENGGSASVALTEAQLPPHTHAVQTAAAGEDRRGARRFLAPTGGPALYGEATSLVALAEEAAPAAGVSAAHENRQPFATLSFIICVNGLYPVWS